MDTGTKTKHGFNLPPLPETEVFRLVSAAGEVMIIAGGGRQASWMMEVVESDDLVTKTPIIPWGHVSSIHDLDLSNPSVVEETVSRSRLVDEGEYFIFHRNEEGYKAFGPVVHAYQRLF